MKAIRTYHQTNVNKQNLTRKTDTEYNSHTHQPYCQLLPGEDVCARQPT
jgi:hypothetical protein